MITPLNEAPAIFKERYNRIKSEENKIDTVAKLKDFWLFAIEQGDNHREMREHIASLTHSIPVTTQIRSLFVRDFAVQESYLSFAGFVAIYGHDNESDDAYSDRLWKQTKEMILTIEDTKLDDQLAQQPQPTQLSAKNAKKVVDDIMK